MSWLASSRWMTIPLALVVASCAKQVAKVDHTAAAPDVEFRAAAVAVPICTPDGNDPKNVVLNHLKNRYSDPEQSDFLDDALTPAQFLARLPDLDHNDDPAPKKRYDFNNEQRARVEQFEVYAIQVRGYFLDGAEEGDESANCDGELGYDWHTWLWSQSDNTLAGRKALRDQAVVAEVTPATQVAHNNWTVGDIKKLAKEKTKVLVTGWIMFDPEHPTEVDKTRASRWEIHPITRIQTMSDGTWIDLEPTH